MNTPEVILVVVAALVIVRVWRRKRGRATGTVTRSEPRRSLLEAAFGDVGLVARREVRERIRGRIFQIGTVIILLVVAAAIVIPVLHKTTAHHPRVGIVGALSTPVRATMDATAASMATTVTLVTEPNQTLADADLRAGHLDLVVIDGQQLQVNKAIADSDTSATAQFVRAVSRALGAEQAYQEAGLSTTQAGIVARAKPLPVTSLHPASTKGTVRTTSLISSILIFVMLSQYNTWTLTGVVEEKASRVVEVLLAAVRPIHLLAGKVLGIGLVAFAQAAIIVTFALGLAKVAGSDLLHGTAPLTLVAALVWLVLGYAFYCWVFAAAGSTAERQEQVQTLAFPLTLPLILGYIVSITAATSGNASTFFKVLAYLPPTAPFAMTVLVDLGKATWWQFGASAAISILATIAVARFASTIYRRAILRTGHRVRLREVLSLKTALRSRRPETSG